jgi:uncharacterized OB-fold protein
LIGGNVIIIPTKEFIQEFTDKKVLECGKCGMIYLEDEKVCPRCGEK